MPQVSNSGKGREGEDRAAAYLASLGYRILARNARLPGGEIDIIALDGTTLVFIEVKARSQRRFGSALAAVDARKRRILRSIAADYAQIVAPRANLRFDIVAVDGNRLTLHRNAF